MRMTPEQFFAPISPEEFRDSFLEKKVMHLERNARDLTAGLFDLTTLEQALYFSHPAKLGAIRVIPRSDEVERSNQYHTTGKTAQAKDMFSKFITEFGSGSTLVLNAWETQNSNILEVTAMLQRLLLCDVKCNIYCTPLGSQGFDTHVDAHDVLILQTDGEKKWRIHDPPHELPLESHSVPHFGPRLSGTFEEARQEYGEPIKEVVLKAGDVLYLPRGVPHSAESTDKHSIHFTLGLYPLRMHQLLSQLLDIVADKHVELRRRIPLDPTSLPTSGDLFRQVAQWADESEEGNEAVRIANYSMKKSQTSISPTGALQTALLVDAIHENTFLSRVDSNYFNI